MSKIKYTDLDGDVQGLHLIECDDWQCGMGDDDTERTPLSLVVEIIDMHEATGEGEFEQYPFLFSLAIVAAKPHESFHEGDYKSTPDGLIRDCYGYMGGVPVDHKFISIDKDNQNFMLELKIKDACLVTKSPTHGTVAAQQGPGSSFTYPQFKTAEAAYDFAKLVIENYGDFIMGMLIGFTLDQPINMIGDTGWSVIEKQVRGRK